MLREKAKTFIGKPCRKAGHTLRYARFPYHCVECHKGSVHKYQDKNRDKCRADNAKWAAANPEKVLAKSRRARAANPQKHRDRNKRWRLANKDKKYAQNARRRALERSRICDCCKTADFQAIYKAAQLIDCEVDHVKPLAAGGVHCVRNLQILSKAAHRAKTALDRVYLTINT